MKTADIIFNTLSTNPIKWWDQRQLGPETRLKLSPKMGVLKVKKLCHPAKKIDKLLASNNW